MKPMKVQATVLLYIKESTEIIIGACFPYGYAKLKQAEKKDSKDTDVYGFDEKVVLYESMHGLLADCVPGFQKLHEAQIAEAINVLARTEREDEA
mmetsp:Transcript_9578/g.13384  ORF Transcript_9578/g.13384 Transcript_9578/m.13384 type:complete len:95 (-) Transcript_9578:155-439(-)